MYLERFDLPSEKQKKKKRKSDVKEEAFEDSDDGDDEGREMDYISDSSERYRVELTVSVWEIELNCSDHISAMSERQGVSELRISNDGG